MTESEAKGFIQGKLDCMKKCGIFNKEDNTSDNECDNCEYCYSQGNFGEQKEAFSMAINALEEVERYKSIGVVSSYEMEQNLLLYKADREILNEYQELGTVEELRLVKEKQIAKKPIIKQDKYCNAYHCPVCNGYIHSTNTRIEVILEENIFCGVCGQKLNWESDEE